MSDSVRWEPVGSMVIRDAEGPHFGGLVYHDDTEVGTSYFETDREYPLPSGVRLCRAVPIEWSQEMPTEVGWWLFCPQQEDEEIWLIYVYKTWSESGDRFGADTGPYTGRLQWVDGMNGCWLPANLPTPPGVKP